ncbi:MAG TPA: TraR/DksA C4-type zinc finger protein [Verrucomicrobiae bacterium]|jgi:RNA polymerase-binding protein DksA|nr:TraR/DksA C4-type zinc finger protein [Verrucomicrobiae bacterium]
MPNKKKSEPKTSAKEEKIDKKDFSKFKKLLEDLRSKIAGSLEHIEGDALNKSQRDAAGDLSGYSFHMADMATDNFDREFNLGLASNEQNILNLIDDAMRKIKDGTYGICEPCSKPIPVKRLLAMPYAPYCIKCQEIEEKKQRPAS